MCVHAVWHSHSGGGLLGSCVGVCLVPSQPAPTLLALQTFLPPATCASHVTPFPSFPWCSHRTCVVCCCPFPADSLVAVHRRGLPEVDCHVCPRYSRLRQLLVILARIPLCAPNIPCVLGALGVLLLGTWVLGTWPSLVRSFRAWARCCPHRLSSILLRCPCSSRADLSWAAIL